MRQEAGIVQTLSAPSLDAALSRYDETLDATLRRQILKVPEDGRLTKSAARSTYPEPPCSAQALQ
jgi:hypothetical protein